MQISEKVYHFSLIEVMFVCGTSFLIDVLNKRSGFAEFVAPKDFTKINFLIVS